MKKTATKLKNSPSRKQLSPGQRKSWLKIYSHVAYFFSVLNLFLFPARVNAAGVPSSTIMLAQPLIIVAHDSGTSCMVSKDLLACNTPCFGIPAADHKDKGTIPPLMPTAKRILDMPTNTPDACHRRLQLFNPPPSPH